MARPRTTKAAANRSTVSRTVLSTIEVNAKEVEDKALGILYPDGAPRTITVSGLLMALAGMLERSDRELQDADHAHSQELGDDDAVRAEREESSAQLREQMIDARATLGGAYGPLVLAAYGLDGDTPTAPDLLLQRARNTASLLRSRPLTETPKRRAVKIDARQLGEELGATAERYDASLKAVQREEREAQVTLNRRNEAMENWSARYQGAADIMTGFCELIGRQDLADRVRPTSRRRAGLPEDGDTPVNPTQPGDPPVTPPR